VEVYDEIRRLVGGDFPVLLKLNAEDFVENGLTFEDTRYVANLFAELGIDAVEISGGTFASGEKNPCRMKIKTAENEAYHAEYAARVAEDVDVPVMVVGGLRSPEVIERLLANTNIAFFSLSRPLLTEPDLPNRWQRGDRTRAKCVSCNVCLQGREGGNVCILNQRKTG
jgi:2,4-dienoyl-CoA reductase-like NADH-dependent reductase (Old Yellow Enzyme family)